jgi:hypothetical protein
MARYFPFDKKGGGAADDDDDYDELAEILWEMEEDSGIITEGIAPKEEEVGPCTRPRCAMLGGNGVDTSGPPSFISTGGSFAVMTSRLIVSCWPVQVEMARMDDYVGVDMFVRPKDRGYDKQAPALDFDAFGEAAGRSSETPGILWGRSLTRIGRSHPAGHRPGGWQC